MCIVVAQSARQHRFGDSIHAYTDINPQIYASTPTCRHVSDISQTTAVPQQQVQDRSAHTEASRLQYPPCCTAELHLSCYSCCCCAVLGGMRIQSNHAPLEGSKLARIPPQKKHRETGRAGGGDRNVASVSGRHVALLLGRGSFLTLLPQPPPCVLAEHHI